MKTGGIVEKVKDPYENSCLLNKFVSDVEAFGKFVDELSVSILGVSRLDTVWKVSVGKEFDVPAVLCVCLGMVVIIIITVILDVVSHDILKTFCTARRIIVTRKIVYYL